jgi:hypothetical protein
MSWASVAPIWNPSYFVGGDWGFKVSMGKKSARLPSQPIKSGVWWHAPVIPATWRHKYEDYGPRQPWPKNRERDPISKIIKAKRLGMWPKQ